jgi:hypothetical protein
MPSSMSMSCKVGSLGSGDLMNISRDSVHKDRDPCKRAGIVAGVVTAISSMTWCSSGCIASGEVSSFSDSDLVGVVDGQGCA